MQQDVLPHHRIDKTMDSCHNDFVCLCTDAARFGAAH